jgi:hypothetical protein
MENADSRLTPSVEIRREQVNTQPARPHQHQASGAVWVVEGETHRRATAQRITHQRNASQAQLIEECLQRCCGVPVELAVLRAFAGVAVAGLIDGQHVEVLREHLDVA